MTVDRDGTLYDRICGWLVCAACLKIRFSPLHGIMRALGICDGDH